MRSVALISLGCAKNRVDAEHLLAGFLRRGFRLEEQPERAEVVVVNTCGFIRDAVEESIEEILEAAQLKQTGACRELVVSGCLPKRYPELAGELPEVDWFFTPEDLERIPDALGGPQEQAAPGGPLRVLSQFPHSAYLKVADGCRNRCTFCTIPAIRGPFRSRSSADLVEEARQLVDQGVVELNLVAQDVTGYGGDRGEPAALDRLLAELEELDGLRWIRLLYAYPRTFPPGVVERLAAGGKVLPYLDIPIQHSHPRILKAMGRPSDAARLEEHLGDLKKRIPGLVLRTTVIIGFPGETDAEFAHLLEFAGRVRFQHLGAFAYSPEEGTPALALRPRVSARKARQRLDRLLEVQAEISAAHNHALLGKTLEILVDGLDEEGTLVGRTYGQAPEVDGHTLLLGAGADTPSGTFVRGRVVEARDYDLVAEVLAP